jgi:hypothetical protein
VTQRLTQSFVDEASADGRDRIVFDSQVPGLGLRITPTGTKIFVAQARVAGQKRRITVGYAADMPLSKARAEAQQMIVAMRNGVDPTAEQRARLRAAAARSVTLRDFSERWLTEHVFPKLKPRTSQGYKEIWPATFSRLSATSPSRRSIVNKLSGCIWHWQTHRAPRIRRSPSFVRYWASPFNTD